MEKKYYNYFWIFLLLAGLSAMFYFWHRDNGLGSKGSVLATTTAYQEFLAVSEPKKICATTSVQFFGDIMLDRTVAKKMGNRGLDYIFEKIDNNDANFFGGSDLLIANLEGPFAPARVRTSKSIAFRFDPALAKQLKDFGFTAFSLANNHSLDMGTKNLAYTRDLLEKNDLHWFGDELSEGPEYTWISTSTGVTIAFIGLQDTFHKLNMEKLDEALQKAKQEAKYVVVNAHWGTEYKQTSNERQRTLGHWLVDHGADVVIGHHPHVIEEVELYQGKPIFYSLGNFIFDQYFSEPTQEGISVGLVMGCDRLSKAYVFPFYGENSQVRQMEGSGKKKFMTWLNSVSRLGGQDLRGGVLELNQ